MSLFKKIDSKKISKEGIRIDVRTAEEYNDYHIEGAINIPYEQITSQIAKITDDKNKLIGVYCLTGIRSQMAKQMLKGLGYTNVVNERNCNAILARLKK